MQLRNLIVAVAVKMKLCDGLECCTQAIHAVQEFDWSQINVPCASAPLSKAAPSGRRSAMLCCCSQTSGQTIVPATFIGHHLSAASLNHARSLLCFNEQLFKCSACSFNL